MNADVSRVLDEKRLLSQASERVEALDMKMSELS